MLYDVVIALHAIAGVICFIAGWKLLRATADRAVERRWFRIYAAGLVGLIVFLGVAIADHWSALTQATQIIYAALFGLGLYMGWRGWLAWLLWRDDRRAVWARFVDHIGFTLIALFDGFVVVAAIDLGAPAWVVAAVAVLGVAGGHWMLAGTKARGGAVTS